MHLTRHCTSSLAAGVLSLTAAFATAAGNPLTLDRAEMAGISGFRTFWDTPVVVSADGATTVRDCGTFGKGNIAVWTPAKRDNGTKPGAAVFDAVHRSLLVRFPGAAAAIAAELGKGQALATAELVLPFREAEYFPELYADPSGMSFLGDLWVRLQPQWHAVAWALRQPWKADAQVGPTYNAFINGAGYWGKFGAQDETRDRFPTRLGPVEVSYKQPLGRLDLAPLLSDPAYGATLGERLRRFEDCGLLVRKEEVYDARYFTGGYEWGVSTGGRGILIGAPRLELTFVAPAKKNEAIGTLAPPADVAALAAALKGTPAAGKPTAVMPTPEQLAESAKKKGFNRPAWMPDWQWQRVQELKNLGGGTEFQADPARYAKWIDDMLSIMPRRWDGFDAAEKVQAYKLYADTWPEPVREHWQLYWWAWLMPWLDVKDIFHSWVQVPQEQAWYAETGDWRGRTTFYRPYCYNMGTMNFNHTAVTGTLIGGGIIGDARTMADGRHGLEQWPLRTWCYFDGSTQESIDHYYFAITLTSQKIFADFGPTEMDRMMGRSILAKSIGELTSAYHPGLRRFISSGGRTGVAELLVIQDGLQHAVHTLSKKGALHDVGNPDTFGMPVCGNDVPPGRVAFQTLNGPWAPDWVGNMLDEKPLPYHQICSYKMWGGFSKTPLWKTNYLGRNYGLACIDVATGNETVPIMAQWRRADQVAEKVQDIGTLLARYGVNRTEFLDSVWHGSQQRNPNGSVGTQGGGTYSLQYRNKMIVLSSPFPKLEYSGGRPLPAKVTSLQTSIALISLQAKPTWELFVDGQPVTALPAKVKFGQRLTIRDGVSFLGIIPIPATNLGRSEEIVITNEGEPTELQGGGKIKTTAVINFYNYYDEQQPLDQNRADLDAAYGGFVLELGDTAEHKDFAAFQKHIAGASLETRWEAGAGTLHVVFTSAKDRLECGFKPGYGGSWDAKLPTDQCFPYRRANGQWPYLAPGVERDCTLTQLGSTGYLEKGDATLLTEPEHMAYLLTDPVSRTCCGLNPFSEPTLWSLQTGQGRAAVLADGKLGMARITVRPSENKLWIDYAVLPEQTGPEMATCLYLTGFSGRPVVERNGQPFTGTVTEIEVKGEKAYAVPLFGDAVKATPDAILQRVQETVLKLAAGKGKPETR